MVTTREQATQNAQQIIRDVFNLGAHSSLEKALTKNGLMDITDWMLLMVSNLELLTYNDNGTEKHPSLGQQNKIHDFWMYVLHEHANGSSASYSGRDIVFDKFDSFCRSNECIRLIMAPQPVAPTLSAPDVVMTSTQSELETFKNGIKSDATLYPVVTQDTEWDLQNCSVVSLLHAQSVTPSFLTSGNLCMTYRTDLQEAQCIIREVFHYGDSLYLELALTENDFMDVTSWIFLTHKSLP
jgi:hypothetical protein